MRYAFLFTILAIALSATLASPTIDGNTNSTGARSGAELYAKHCASCHGRDGRAKTLKGKLNHARNLTDPEWAARVGDERIFNSIMNGKGKMPAYEKKLSEQEVDSLVAYVRGLKK